MLEQIFGGFRTLLRFLAIHLLIQSWFPTDVLILVVDIVYHLKDVKILDEVSTNPVL